MTEKKYIHRPNYERIVKLSTKLSIVHELWSHGFLSHEEEQGLILRIWKEIYWEMTGKSWIKENPNGK